MNRPVFRLDMDQQPSVPDDATKQAVQQCRFEMSSGEVLYTDFTQETLRGVS